MSTQANPSIFVITAIRQTSRSAPITEVQFGVWSRGTLVPAPIQTKAEIVRFICGGIDIRTVRVEGGKKVLGAKVVGVPSHAPKYLRTDANNILEDNLGELPRF